jgi:hypothetical protein
MRTKKNPMLIGLSTDAYRKKTDKHRILGAKLLLQNIERTFECFGLLLMELMRLLKLEILFFVISVLT